VRFGRAEERVFAALTEALVDREVDGARVRSVLATIASSAPGHVAWGLRAILWLAWILPVVTFTRACSFTSLGRGEQAALWARTLGHASYLVRQLALTAKAMACLCAFDGEEPSPELTRAPSRLPLLTRAS
jgi:hypothetical protein